MEIDIKVIKKYAMEKEDENWMFRLFLKGYENHDLDDILHELFRQVSAAIDCTACGNCCKTIPPHLNRKDILKLSKTLEIAPERFISDYVYKNEDGDLVMKRMPCPFLIEKKCAHYDSRPADCASYPHLHKSDFAYRLIGVIQNYSICPIVFNVYEALKHKLRSEFKDFQVYLCNHQYP
ncbi:MAG: YkgJ family cysteine cluster protein [Desulfobacterales bacterium]|jgi:hypothetical protein